MGRTSNDDRSDTMNPNNDAYDADQANRAGDVTEDDDDGPGQPAPRGVRPDLRFGPDPHPVLGWRSNRLPSLSGYQGLAEPSEVVPLVEGLAVLFATDESDARDRALAHEEMMRVAQWILSVSSEAMTRQGNSAVVSTEDGEDGRVSTLKHGEHLRLSVRASKKFEVLLVEYVYPDHGYHGTPLRSELKAFKFARLRWQVARARERGRGYTGAMTQAERAEAERREHEIVSYEIDTFAYRSPMHGRPGDPAEAIVEAVRKWAPPRNTSNPPIGSS